MTMNRWWGVAVALAVLAPSEAGFAQSVDQSLAEEVGRSGKKSRA
jgi:hypothetical protein